MKIRRETGFDKVSFAFRLLLLNKEQLSTLSNQLYERGIKFEAFEKYKKIIIKVANKKDMRQLLSAKSNLDGIQYDIWISINSSYDHGGLTVPDYILALIYEFKCPVQFSYIIC